MRRKGKKITKRKRIERCNCTSQTVNMPADVMKVLMDRGHDGKINIFVSPFPSFFPLCHRFRKTQTSKRQSWVSGTDCLAHLHLQLSHQATHNAQQLSLSVSLPLSRPRRPAPECSSNCLLTPLPDPSTSRSSHIQTN